MIDSLQIQERKPTRTFANVNKAAKRTHLDKALWNIFKAKKKRKPKVEEAFEKDFTLPELMAAVKKLKPRKAPGPDKIKNEMIVNLRPSTKVILLTYIEIWQDMKSIYLESAEKILGKKTKKAQKPFISDEILKLSKDKKKARTENKQEEYKRLKKELRKKIRKEKKDWLEQECAKINTANEQRKSEELYQQIKKVKGNKLFVKNQCIKDENGNTLTESNDVLGRWHDYGKGLFSFPKPPTDLDFSEDDLEPIPLFHEVESAIYQLKSGKAPGLDNVPSELLKFSDLSSKKAIHTLCCNIWKTGLWPDEWK